MTTPKLTSLGFGRPGDLRAIADRINTEPGPIDLRAVALHLRAAAVRIEGHEKTRQAEAERAARRQSAQMRGVVAAGLAEGVAFDPDGYFVYCLWGKDPTTPLYVGQSSNILSRLGSHLGSSTKRRSVKTVTLTRCSTYARMRALEVELIREYQPPWNHVGIVLVDR